MSSTKMNNSITPGLQSIAPGLQAIAPGLPNFDTDKWFHSPNGSIYLKFLPQDMDKEDIQKVFEFAGKIERIDIVNSAPNKTTGATYRMAFIHFEYWYSTGTSLDFRHNIIQQFPNQCHMYSPIVQRELSVTINTRPVPKTNYNVDQLSDMFHRLQEQFTTTVEKQAQEITELKEEIDRMKRITQHISCDYYNLAEELEEVTFGMKKIINDIDEIITCSYGANQVIDQLLQLQVKKLEN